MWSVTCATSKMQNRTVPGGEGQMTWFKWDKLYIIRCEMTKRCWNWRGNLNIYPAKEVILQEFHTIRSFSFCYEYNSVQPSTWLNHVTCITTCTWLYNTQIKDFAHSAGWSRVMAHIHGITLSSDRALSPGTYQIFSPHIIWILPGNINRLLLKFWPCEITGDKIKIWHYLFLSNKSPKNNQISFWWNNLNLDKAYFRDG